MLGQRFGRLIVVSIGSGRSVLVKCDCGMEKEVTRSNLQGGNTNSCGCLKRKLIGDRSRTHGKRWTAEYGVWLNMRSRCFNPKNKHYKDYGGRGIKQCERWDDFSKFLEDMGERPSREHRIERRDNDGPYCPENCCWATEYEQSRNRRSTHNVTYHGVTKCLTDWQAITGIPRKQIAYRLNRGWDIEDVFNVPVIYGRNTH